LHDAVVSLILIFGTLAGVRRNEGVCYRVIAAKGVIVAADRGGSGIENSGSAGAWRYAVQPSYPSDFMQVQHAGISAVRRIACGHRRRKEDR
jgi:hypothetical protein